MAERLNAAVALAGRPADEPELLSRSGAPLALPPAATRVLFASAEMAGFVKTGGLGDVAAVLPRKLRGFCDVRVLLPGLPQVRRAAAHATPPLTIIRQMPATAALPPYSLGRFRTADGLVVYVVLCDELYNRGGTPYGPRPGEGFADNDVRFARLALAVAEVADGVADPDWRADLVHVNDWHTALACGYLQWRHSNVPSILTIHNPAYQGLCARDRLPALAIPETAFQLDGVEFYGRISFLKAGIQYATQVTTVSETYAREITTPEFGYGLEGLLAKRLGEGRLTGIVNGIDDSWNRSRPDCAANVVQRWKQANAAEIRAIHRLPETGGPLFSVISRLVHQKGVDLSLAAAESIVALGGQLVVMGEGEPALENAARRLARKYPRAVAAHIGFDEASGRRLYAASDFLLMPSRFEPCGLSQMYAQKSGALPIAARTGGLVDTIEDGVSGFLFAPLTRHALVGSVMRALATFRARPIYQAMRAHALAQRFGWRRPVRKYLGVYAHLLAGRA